MSGEAIGLLTAVAAIALGGVSFWVSESRAAKRKRDERSELIAMAAGYGIEHVPGEDIDRFRQNVMARRDRDAARIEGEQRLAEWRARWS